MTYINPYESDEQTIRSHGVLSRKQARKDFLSAQAEGGFDAAIHASKRPEKACLLDGFKRIPGASRSGALDPQTKARMLRQEAEGLIELQRNVYGELVAYRPINNESEED